MPAPHRALEPAQAERLRAVLAGDGPVGGGDGDGEEPPAPPAAPVAEGPGGPEQPARSSGRIALVGAAKRALRPVAGPVLRRAVELVVVRVLERLAPERQAERTALDQVAVDVELLRGELQSVEALLAMGWRGALASAPSALAEQLRRVEVNAELLKGDLRSLAVRLDDVGWAVAPGAGLEGVPERFAELRERVNALDRRIRTLASPPPPAAAPASVASPEVTPPVDRFDYVGFERRFRGDPETILATLEERYIEVLRQHPPVLDVGCGRGELLSVLAARGVACRGVDLNPEMVAEARDAGLDVAQGDAIAHLRTLPEHSLGSIIAIHVVEHLELHALTELLELAATRLVPGGVLVAETPNPTSLIVLGNSYILDPTHVWPLHPSLLTFLCERAGFRDVRLAFHSPAEDYRLPRIDPPDGARWADPVNDTVDRLNLVLFGPQEYSVTATTPPLPTATPEA